MGFKIELAHKKFLSAQEIKEIIDLIEEFLKEKKLNLKIDSWSNFS